MTNTLEHTPLPPIEGPDGVTAQVIDWPEGTTAPLSVEIAGVRFVRSAETTSDEPETRPLLKRLVPSILSSDIEAQQTQPLFGASVSVTPSFSADREPKTIWMPAAAWEGIGTIIRQTPDHCRAAVAAFLIVVHTNMRATDPLHALLGEVIREVEHDPYGEMPADDTRSFDFLWS